MTSLARGAAAMTAATALSRVTGFIRVVVVAGAMGTTFLANTYQTANTAPNILFELVAAGVLTSVFVPTFVEYLVRNERERAWDAANALASVALVGLVGLALVLGLAAPLIMRVLTLGVGDAALRRDEISLGSTFLRLFAPQIVFYGAGMIMTAALHAHRRFAMSAIAPIFNNVVVIVVYLVYAFMRGDRPPAPGTITDAEKLVLGAGTTLGVVAMTLCLIPALTKLGWRLRFDLDLHHPAVRKGARLGVWALGYAGGYQAGLVVVLLLANRIEGGVAAYQWAYTFFYLPHALFAVPLFNVLFTAMSEHAARRETEDLAARLDGGLRMLAFILLPVAAGLIAMSSALSRLTLDYGVMTEEGTILVARVLAAFAIGLPTYSAFLVFTRARYALGDTRGPAVANAISAAAASVSGALMFLAAPQGWEIAGLALGHSAGFALGAWLLALSLRELGTGFATVELGRSARRSVVGAIAAAAPMVVVAGAIGAGSRSAALVSLVAASGIGGAVYIGFARLTGAPELNRIASLARGR